MNLLSHYFNPTNKNGLETINWKDVSISENLTYSYRDTSYTEKTYPSNLHYHDYYEVVFIENGYINYVCDNLIFAPSVADVVIVPPNVLHMSKINAKSTRYIRHVFYFYPQVFNLFNKDVMHDFFEKTQKNYILSLSTVMDKESCLEILNKISKLVEDDVNIKEKTLIFAYLIELLCIFDKKASVIKSDKNCLPNKLLEVKNYIDNYYVDINSVADIAKKFFYSREHLSRSFKKYFNITIADYLSKKRIIKSQELFKKNKSVTEVCYMVGYNSLSTFIRIFKNVTNMSPSEYKKQIMKL